MLSLGSRLTPRGVILPIFRKGKRGVGLVPAQPAPGPSEAETPSPQGTGLSTHPDPRQSPRAPSELRSSGLEELCSSAPCHLLSPAGQGGSRAEELSGPRSASVAPVLSWHGAPGRRMLGATNPANKGLSSQGKQKTPGHSLECPARKEGQGRLNPEAAEPLPSPVVSDGRRGEKGKSGPVCHHLLQEALHPHSGLNPPRLLHRLSASQPGPQ